MGGRGWKRAVRTYGREDLRATNTLYTLTTHRHTGPGLRSTADTEPRDGGDEQDEHRNRHGEQDVHISVRAGGDEPTGIQRGGNTPRSDHTPVRGVRRPDPGGREGVHPKGRGVKHHEGKSQICRRRNGSEDRPVGTEGQRGNEEDGGSPRRVGPVPKGTGRGQGRAGPGQ